MQQEIARIVDIIGKVRLRERIIFDTKVASVHFESFSYIYKLFSTTNHLFKSKIIFSYVESIELQ